MIPLASPFRADKELEIVVRAAQSIAVGNTLQLKQEREQVARTCLSRRIRGTNAALADGDIPVGIALV